MDIIFNCPNCEQELAVDQSGAGSNIECPNCNQSITIPSSSNPKVTTGSLPPVPPPPPAPLASTVATSAAAKQELHLKVPISDKPAAPLIGKSKPPLEVVQKGAGKRLRIRTIRRASCVESGHDHFDERVSDFLQEVGETNIVSIHTVTYEYFDVGVQKIVADYGLLVIFRG
jgi:DNA-directed RNA polymerase subunit RPC12/RpoP